MSTTKTQSQALAAAIEQCVDARRSLKKAVNVLRDLQDELTNDDIVTPGWMMAPFEPTQAMVDAADAQWRATNRLGTQDAQATCRVIYAAMLGAVQFEPVKAPVRLGRCHHCGKRPASFGHTWCMECRHAFAAKSKP